MIKSLAIIALGASVLGCGATRTTARHKAETQVQTQDVSCDALPTGLDDRMKAGAITIFGELHGTKEVPDFVGDVACVASKSTPVIVGFEIPANIESSIGTFLESDGSEAAKQALMKGRFWTLQDGRSSKAMLALLDSLRQLKRAGRQVDVFAFDGVFPGAEARDAGMAKNIVKKLQEAKQAESVTLILSGNLHARTDSERWMGWHVRKALPEARALNNQFAGGTAWFCSSDGECGAGELNGQDRGTTRFVEIADEPDDHGYHGIFYVGAVTASPPAR